MKTTKLFSLLLTFLLFSTVYPQSGFAQDSTRFDLPEDANPESWKASINAIQYSRDGKLLAIASPSGVWLYDIDSSKEEPLLKRRIDGISSVSLSPDGKTLAGGGDQEIYLWDAETGAHKRTLKGHKAFIWSVSFSPDGKTLVSGSRDKTIRLWDVETGVQKQTLRGHTDEVLSVSFSPDGKTLASGGWDATIRLWDVKKGRHKHMIRGDTQSISSVSFSPDGKTLASGSGSEIRLWDLSTIVYSARARIFSTRRSREGFIWGIGVGTGMASYTQSLVEYWGNAYEGPRLEARGRESAFITNFRIGHGLTDQVLFYYTSRIAWIPLRNLYRDTVIANGTAGLGVTIYPHNKSNFYLSGSVGLSTLATWFPPLELEKARATGLAVSAGIGYEFFPHSSVDLTVSVGNASRTEIDERNYIELTNEVITVLLTLNGLAY